MNAKLPTPRNPIKDAEHDFEVLLDQLKTAIRERDEAVDLSRRMVAEAEAKGVIIERQAADLQRKDLRIMALQSYAGRLTGRLSAIKEVITAAEREAAQEFVQVMQPPARTEPETPKQARPPQPDPVGFNDGALDIRLPTNRLTN